MNAQRHQRQRSAGLRALGADVLLEGVHLLHPTLRVHCAHGLRHRANLICKLDTTPLHVPAGALYACVCAPSSPKRKGQGGGLMSGAALCYVCHDSQLSLLWPWPVSKEGGDDTSEVAVTDETVKEDSAAQTAVHHTFCCAQLRRNCAERLPKSVHEGCVVPADSCSQRRLPSLGLDLGPEPSGSRRASIWVRFVSSIEEVFVGMPRLPSPSSPSA